MRDFDLGSMPYEPCPKCRNNDTPDAEMHWWRWNALHIPAHVSRDGGVYGTYDVTYTVATTTTVPEHLEVSCANCSYSFQMETADAKAEVPA